MVWHSFSQILWSSFRSNGWFQISPGVFDWVLLILFWWPGHLRTFRVVPNALFTLHDLSPIGWLPTGFCSPLLLQPTRADTGVAAKCKRAEQHPHVFLHPCSSSFFLFFHYIVAHKWAGLLSTLCPCLWWKTSAHTLRSHISCVISCISFWYKKVVWGPSRAIGNTMENHVGWRLPARWQRVT